jgi:FPC/CPF motif-containing protein YcgG
MSTQHRTMGSQKIKKLSSYDASVLWLTLTNKQRNNWNSFARKLNKLDRRVCFSGRQSFISYHSMNTLLGNVMKMDPPANPSPLMIRFFYYVANP